MPPAVAGANFTPVPGVPTPSTPASTAIPPAIPNVNYSPVPNFSAYPTGRPTYAPPSGQAPNYSSYPSGAPAYAPPPAFATQPIPEVKPVLPPPPPAPPVAPPTPSPIPTTGAPTESTPTPTPAQPGAQKPPLPPDSPEAQRAYDSANKAYQEALRISPEEISTQEDVDKLIEATKKAYRDTRGQPIALEFITGQLKSLEERAIGLAEPLERKLSRLQAQRTSAVEASKFALERSDKAKADAESARRFGVEQAGAAETRGLAATKESREKAEDERTFAENQRQFGLDYAIKQRQSTIQERQTTATERQAGVAEREVAVKEAAGVTTGITSETGQALQLVNELLPRVDEISGLIRTGKFTGSNAKLQQLTSTLSLNARKLIKGTGTVSDFEARMLQETATALDSGYFSGRMSNNYIEGELKRIRGVLNANAGQQVMVKITNPNTNEIKQGNLGRDDIFSAASQGFIIEYQ